MPVGSTPEGLGYSRVYYHLMISILQHNTPVKDLNVYSDVKQPDGIYEPRVEMMRMYLRDNSFKVRVEAWDIYIRK